jgi:hypothetical protein
MGLRLAGSRPGNPYFRAAPRLSTEAVKMV